MSDTTGSSASAQAAASLRKLIDDPDIPDAVRKAMAPEFNELARALEKLDNDEIHIAAFGRVSVGKSALLNGLLGREEFTVGVLHGTTIGTEQERWRSSISVSASGASFTASPSGESLSTVSPSGKTYRSATIHVIDTPGIDELGGEARERLAFVLPGETAFRVVDPETVPDPAAPTVDVTGSGPALVAAGTTTPWYATIWESVQVAGAADVADANTTPASAPAATPASTPAPTEAPPTPNGTP